MERLKQYGVVMSGTVNKVILIGNLGNTPELKRSDSGGPILTFSLATNQRKRSANGEYIDHTEWHNIVVFGKQAEILHQYATKGSSIYIEGKLRTRSWESNNRKHYKVEVVLSEFMFTGNKSNEEYAAVPEQPSKDLSSDVDLEDIPF